MRHARPRAGHPRLGRRLKVVDGRNKSGHDEEGKGKPMQTFLTVLGIILLLAGLVFMGQGSGYFPYPAESFMISQSRWVYYGAAIAVVGALILVATLRR
jgi:hypothetical protein